MDAMYPTDWWTSLDDGRVQCDVCPRRCKLHEGQRGLCFVRARHDHRVVLTTYGRSSGFAIDPIEKKPLHHFLPGSDVLSFGTAGCNLACRFCQNWDITKSHETDVLAHRATPSHIAAAAIEHGCASVAFTYNDPVVFLEYAADTAVACREVGLRTVAVSAGYVEPGPRARLFEHIDAANIDLKAFTDDYYRHVCGGRLAPVLETLEWLAATDTWLEVTTLLVPGLNDGEGELHLMAEWFAGHLGPDVPWHFTAFHPDHKMMGHPATGLDSLRRARRIAQSFGLRYVYTGNVHDLEGGTTRCPGCGSPVVTRDRYMIVHHALTGGCCERCGTRIAGRFGAGDAASVATGHRRRMGRVRIDVSEAEVTG